MSEYKESIQVFANLIKAKVIPTEDLPDLLKVVEEMPKDDEEIAREIDNWLKPESRSEIKEIYMVNLRNLSEIDLTTLGWGNSKMESGKESESSKELLINTIKENTPEPKPEKNSEDKSEDN